MNQELIDMAEKAGVAFSSDEYPDIWSTYMHVGKEEIEAFAALVAAAEREACAKVAGKLWQSFKDTKDAHERNSINAFMGSRFGFVTATIQQSKQIMEAIRARGETE